MSYLSYPLAIFYGLYYYVIFQIVFLARFGRFNTHVGWLDFVPIAIGIISALGLRYFARRLPQGRGLLVAVFAVALPFSVVLTLGGGLVLMPIGTIILGLLPFAIALPAGYWIVKRYGTAARD